MADLPANLCAFIDEPPRSLTVLLIDQSAEDREAIGAAVTGHFGKGRIRTACRVSEALADGLEDVDLIIAGTDLPDLPGIGVLEEIFLLRPDLPVLLTAPANDPQLAVKAIRCGAYDFLVKSPGFLEIIPVAIEKNLVLHRIKQENARLQVQLTSTLAQLRAKNGQLQNLVKELETIAATDALTALPNRRAFASALDQRFAHSLRNDTDLSLITIDLDGFKQLNDTAGHPAGDRMLMLVGRVLRANCRASDIPGRIGGDEFVVLLPETDLDEARSVAGRIKADFEDAAAALCASMDYAGTTSMSLGLVSRAGVRVVCPETFFNLADRALYRAKELGRSRLVIHQDRPLQDVVMPMD